MAITNTSTDEDEKALREHERERRDAPIWKRAKWWILGYDESLDKG